jgi:hypothetical protein
MEGDPVRISGEKFAELGGGGSGLPGALVGKKFPTGAPACENVALMGVPAYEVYGLPPAFGRERRSPPPQRFLTPVASAATIPCVLSGPVTTSVTLEPTLTVQPVQTHTPPMTPTHLRYE